MVMLAAEMSLAAETPPAATSGATNALVREIEPGVLQIGGVRLDQRARTVMFPAKLNMNDGLIEYLIVTTTGKTHESLLSTEIEPYHLQTALLLLGAKGAPPQHLTNAPSGGPITAEQLAHMEEIKGDPVSIAVSWKIKDRETRQAIEDAVLNLKTKSRMTRGDFTFNGSQVWEGTFIAQRDGSIVSTIIDPDAMFNNPRPGHENDEIWQIIPKGLPPRGTPVTVTISLKTPKRTH